MVAVSSPAGWYPDPGGQRGKYRYWNGETWSAQLSSTPQAPPPAGGLIGHVADDTGTSAQPAPRRSTGLWIAVGAAVVIFGLVAYLVVRAVGGAGLGMGGASGGNASTNLLLKMKSDVTPRAHPADGRVHGGALSYPQLGSPWGTPQSDTRVPFGRDVQSQSIVVEPLYNRTSSWVASVLVGELVAGDGFFTPQEGSEIVVKCLLGAFYGDAKVGREDQVSKATTVDGKQAWLTETHLTFDIKGLKTKGELAIVLIVATSPESSSLFYASIPDTSPQYLEPARQAMAELKVT